MIPLQFDIGLTRKIAIKREEEVEEEEKNII